MSKNVIIAIVVGLLLLGGILYVQGQNKGNQAPATTQEEQASPSPESILPTVKEFRVENEGLTFKPNEMRIKKGDTVKVTFKVGKGMHVWTVDEFNTKTKQLNAGEEETIEFLADKAGTFEYYCSVPGHREAGMVGKLIVEE